MRIVCLWGGLMLLVGCGYRPLLTRGTDTVAAVFVKDVENQTAYREIAPSLVTALRAHSNRYGIAVTDDATGASCLLSVRVFDIVDDTAAFALRNDREMPLVRNWEIRAMVTLTSPDGKLLMAPRVINAAVDSRAPNAINAENVLTTHAHQQLVDGLARRIAQLLASSI